jgi:hypothetical protein
MRIRAGTPLPSRPPEAGDVVVVRLGSTASSLKTLDRVLRMLSRASLRPVSLRDLRASAWSTDPTLRERARIAAPPTTSTIAATSAAFTHGSPLQASLARNGASTTGTSVVSASTTGAT